MNTCLIVLLLNEILLIFVSHPGFKLFYEDQPDTAAGIAVFVLVNMFIGMLILSLPWFVGAFIMVRLRDYIVLYQSYDDNSVVDKVARLLNAVGRAIFDGLHGICLLPIYALGLIKSDKGIPNESMETEDMAFI